MFPAYRTVNLPNLLSCLRVALIPVLVEALLAGRFAVAFAVFTVAALSDLLDGILARALRQSSRVGAYLDAAADKLLFVTIALVLSLPLDHLTYHIPIGLVLLMMGRDVVIGAGAFLLYRRAGVSDFPPSIVGKAHTLLQGLMLGGALLVNLGLGRLELAVHDLVALTALTSLISGAHYAWRGVAHFRTLRRALVTVIR